MDAFTGDLLAGLDLLYKRVLFLDAKVFEIVRFTKCNKPGLYRVDIMATYPGSYHFLASYHEKHVGNKLNLKVITPSPVEV